MDENIIHAVHFNRLLKGKPFARKGLLGEQTAEEATLFQPGGFVASLLLCSRGRTIGWLHRKAAAGRT